MTRLLIESIKFFPSHDGLINTSKNKKISDFSSYTHKLSHPKLLDNNRLMQLQEFANTDVENTSKEFNPVIYAWCRDSTSPVQKINVHDTERHGCSLTFEPGFIPSENHNPILFYLVTKYTEDCQGVSGISGQSWLDWTSIFTSPHSIQIPIYKVLTDNKLRHRGDLVLKNISYTGVKKMKNSKTIDDTDIVKDGWSTESIIFQNGGLSPYDDNHKITHSIIYVTGGRLITAAPYFIHIQPEYISEKVFDDLLRLGCYMMRLDTKNIDRNKFNLYAVAFAQGLSLMTKLCYYRTDVARYIDKYKMIGCTTDDDLWSDVGLTGSGDCEDMAKFSFSLVCGLLDCPNESKSDFISFAQEIISMYIPFMMHGGVTVGSANKISDNDGYTSHMFTILLPRRRFLQSLYYGCTNGIEQVSNIKIKNHASIVDLSTIDSNFSDNPLIPTLVIEGTGFLDPTVIPLGLACHMDVRSYDKLFTSEKKILEENSCLQFGGMGFQCRPSMTLEELLKKKRCSNFYKSIVSGVTHYRFTREFSSREHELTSFVFHDIGRTYGIPMTQFLLYYSSVSDDIIQLVSPKDDCFRPSSHLFTIPSSIRTKEKFQNILDTTKSWVIPPSSISSMVGLYDTIDHIEDIPVIHDINNILSKNKNFMIIRYNPIIISALKNFNKIFIYPLSKFNTSNIEISMIIVCF